MTRAEQLILENQQRLAIALKGIIEFGYSHRGWFGMSLEARSLADINREVKQFIKEETKNDNV